MYCVSSFTCIPQPMAYKTKIEGAQQAIAETATNPAAPPPRAGVVSHPGMVQDHRQQSAGEETDAVMSRLVRELKAAVDSIPSYVERATILWILVPPCDHRDVAGAVCDFNSWRSRG